MWLLARDRLDKFLAPFPLTADRLFFCRLAAMAENSRSLYGDGYATVRIVAGLFMLTAAIAKTHHVSLGRPLDFSTGWAHASVVLLIEAEWLMAAVLLTGLCPLLMRFVAPSVLVFFALFAVSRAIDGANSCGCFGAITIHPWVIATSDLLLAGMLLFFGSWRPTNLLRQAQAQEATGLRWIGCLAAVLVPLPALLMSQPSALADNGTITGDSKVIVVAPTSWLGKPFPLLPYIKTEADLSRGQWTLLFIREGCDKCQAELASREALSRQAVGLPLRFATIAVPAVENDSGKTALRSDRSSSADGMLVSRFDWWIKTPLEVELENGVVRWIRMPRESKLDDA